MPTARIDLDGYDGWDQFKSAASAVIIAIKIEMRPNVELKGVNQLVDATAATIQGLSQDVSTALDACTCRESSSQKSNNKQNGNNSYQQDTKADQLKANAAQGKATEQAAEKTLKDEGKEIVGK